MCAMSVEFSARDAKAAVRAHASHAFSKLASDAQLLKYAAPELNAVPGFRAATNAVRKGALKAAKATSGGKK